MLCFLCLFVFASVWFILAFFQAHLVYFKKTEVATLSGRLAFGYRIARLAFLTPNFTNLAFLETTGVKNLFVFLAFSFEYLAFFGGS